MESLQFKKAGKNDIPVIHELAQRIWRSHYPAIISAEQIDYMLGKMYSSESLTDQMDYGHVFWMVTDGAVPLGYLSYSALFDGDYFLHKFYIDTTRHRKGIGTQLFHFVVKNLPDLVRIRLTVNRKNFTAINYYFKIGFRIEEVKDFDIGQGYEMNDFVMVWEKNKQKM